MRPQPSEPKVERPKLRISRVVLAEGGVELPPYGTQLVLHAQRPASKIVGMGAPDLEMDIDRALGALLVTYMQGDAVRSVVVPMARVRSIELG